MVDEDRRKQAVGIPDGSLGRAAAAAAAATSGCTAFERQKGVAEGLHRPDEQRQACRPASSAAARATGLLSRASSHGMLEAPDVESHLGIRRPGEVPAGGRRTCLALQRPQQDGEAVVARRAACSGGIARNFFFFFLFFF